MIHLSTAEIPPTAANADIELALSPPSPPLASSPNSPSPQPSTLRRRSLRPDGYPSFAAFIAHDTDAAIYRRFGRLSARNLLYLQSELHALEGDLEALDAEDATLDAATLGGDEEVQEMARDWRYLADERDDFRERAQKHRRVRKRIREKMKEYHEALVLESKVLALRSPDSRTLAAFKKWFSVVVPVLWGRDRMLFDDTNDLAALAPLAETDRLNLLLQRYCGWMFRQGEKTPYDKKDETTEDLARIRERARTAGLFYYPHHSVQVAGAIISTIFSAVLLVGAIVSLLATSGSSSNGLRVAIVVIFTCVFALVVGLLTNARRAEIFGATAAYAAVLVVFLGNNLGNTSSLTPSG